MAKGVTEATVRLFREQSDLEAALQGSVYVTTTTETARRSFVTRFAAFGLLLGALTSVGCDQSDDQACRPDEGCDGIAAIVELEAPAPLEAYVADAGTAEDDESADANDDYTAGPNPTHDDDGRPDAADDYQSDPETTHDDPGDLTGELRPTHDPSDVAIDDFADSPRSTHDELEPIMAEAIECADPEAEGVNYIAQDAEVCATVSVLCLPGWQNIRPECGCGCEFTGEHDPSSYAAE